MSERKLLQLEERIQNIEALLNSLHPVQAGPNQVLRERKLADGRTIQVPVMILTKKSDAEKLTPYQLATSLGTAANECLVTSFEVGGVKTSDSVDFDENYKPDNETE